MSEAACYVSVRFIVLVLPLLGRVIFAVCLYEVCFGHPVALHAEKFLSLEEGARCAFCKYQC